MQPRLFIAIATGQNVSNLPPLLENLTAKDKLVWLETTAAKKNAWAQGAIEVLYSRGITQQQQLEIGENLAEHSQQFAAFLSQLPKQQEVVFIGNGGTKLQLLALWQQLIHSHPTSSLLYGEAFPCAYSFTQAPIQTTKICPYQHQALTLNEVLLCSGHSTLSASAETLIWPAAKPPKLTTQYGKNAEYSGRLHQQHQAWSAASKSTAANALPRFQQIQEIFNQANPSRLKGFYKTLAAAVRSLVLSPKNANGNRRIYSLEEAEANLSNNPERATAIFSNVLKLAEEAVHAQATLHIKKPKEGIGSALEEAVAARVYAWLANNPTVQTVVAQAHAGVQVVANNDPAKILAEFDVVLVLKNGVLLNLECKSHSISRKDMDARETNLTKTASQLARTKIVLPLFTSFAQEAWFANSYQLYTSYASLAFTLPNQPETAVILDSTTNSEVTLHIPTFEAALNKLLHAYLPK